MRQSIWASTVVGAALMSGCATTPPITEATSKAIAEVRGKCAATAGCTVTSIETHGRFWWVSTHDALPANTIGGDGEIYIIDRRLDRIARIRISE